MCTDALLHRKNASFHELTSSLNRLFIYFISTPEYQSPEQGRGLTDHRSDLYSLGVLLFRLYTRHFPIEASSDKEYRVAHMLQPPYLVSDFRPCHLMFDKIIARLLVKAPDERYLTAAGLKHDLEQLLALINNKETNGSTKTFELGTREVPFILIIPNELIGRSKEFSVLDELYDTCLDPRKSGLCYLEGKPGVGKTALIQAFATKQHNPFFFSYKFNQFGDFPMRAIIQVRASVLALSCSLRVFHLATCSFSFALMFFLDNESTCCSDSGIRAVFR